MNNCMGLFGMSGLQDLNHTIPTMLSSNMCKCCFPKSRRTAKQKNLQAVEFSQFSQFRIKMEKKERTKRKRTSK